MELDKAFRELDKYKHLRSVINGFHRELTRRSRIKGDPKEAIEEIEKEFSESMAALKGKLNAPEENR